MSKKDILTFGDDDIPEDLPEVKHKAKALDAVQAARICEKCDSTSVRINSNSNGHRAWCNNCGHNWALSMAAATAMPSGLLQRGLNRQTVVEPDWNLAFEDLEDWPDDKDKR